MFTEWFIKFKHGNTFIFTVEAYEEYNNIKDNDCIVSEKQYFEEEVVNETKKIVPNLLWIASTDKDKLKLLNKIKYIEFNPNITSVEHIFIDDNIENRDILEKVWINDRIRLEKLYDDKVIDRKSLVEKLKSNRLSLESLYNKIVGKEDYLDIVIIVSWDVMHEQRFWLL